MRGEWLQWYYLIFVLPAGVSLLLLLVSGLGALGDGDANADAGMDGGDTLVHDGAVDLSDGDGDGDDDADGFGFGPRDVLGLSRAPLSIGLGALLLGWGLSGIAALEFLRPSLAAPDRFLAPVVGLAVAGALAMSHLVGLTYRAVMPKDESFAVTREHLVGCEGKAIFPVSDTAGRVHVYDQYRTLHTASARVAPGQPAVPRGAMVTILDVDPRGRLLVEPALPTMAENPPRAR